MVLAFANNYRAGYGPGTLDLFLRLSADARLPAPVAEQPSFFNP